MSTSEDKAFQDSVNAGRKIQRVIMILTAATLAMFVANGASAILNGGLAGILSI